jgi:DNA-binding NtrC family response regulator
MDETPGGALAQRTCGTVVLLGNISVELLKLDSLIAEFGWVLKRAAGFGRLRDLSNDDHVIAVLFDANALHLSWIEALNSVQEAASSALSIVCHRFSDRINWPELAEAGAYHALRLPLDECELRQSLGFVCAAKNHHVRNVIPLRPVDRAKILTTSHNRAHAAGSAA